MKWFQQIKAEGLEPDVMTYNAVISAFGSRKDINQMELYYESMKQSGLRPNTSVYNSLLQGYALTGKTS